MITLISVGILSVAFAYIAKNKNLRYFYIFSWIVIFLFLALRYNYGNDYQNYLDYFLSLRERPSFESIKSLVMDSLLYKMVYSNNQGVQLVIAESALNVEFGWRLLCLLFQPLGFFSMVASLALFDCIVYYSFIKRFVPPSYYWLAVFLYFFSPNMMLYLSTTMRQSVAVSLFVISIKYILNKEFFKYTGMIFLASLFHRSSIILLPLYLINIKINKSLAIGILFIYLSSFFLGEQLLLIFNKVTSSYGLKYFIYTEPIRTGLGLGMLFNLIILILLLFYYRNNSNKLVIFINLTIIYIILFPLKYTIPIISRLNMYFFPFFIVVYPYILIRKYRNFPKYPFILLVIYYTVAAFWGYTHSPIVRDSLGTYKTIFSSPDIY